MDRSNRPPLITPEVPALYKRAIQEVATTWNDTERHYDRGFPGSSQYYFTMFNILTDRMIAAEPAVEKVAKAVSNQAGIEVISRFFYIGAAKAGLQGYDVDQLGAALYTPHSFRQLVPLTREVNASARYIEHHIGLTDSPYDEHLDEFQLNDQGLSITKYALHRYIARSTMVDKELLTPEQAYTDNPDDDPIRCEGFKSGLTTAAYKYILGICMKDPLLFETTIASKKVTEADSVA